MSPGSKSSRKSRTISLSGHQGASDKPRAICPRCGKPGYGAYIKAIPGYKGKVYRYWYFAHPAPGKGPRGVKWCYLGKAIELGHDPGDKDDLADAVRELGPKVRELEQAGLLRCLACGAPLDPGDLRVYRHGEHVWPWLKCRECGHENALAKLLEMADRHGRGYTHDGGDGA